MFLGQQFSSFIELEQHLEDYKKKKFTDFYIHDCRTLAVARNKYPIKLKFTPDALKYYFIKYLCVHGGHHKKRKTCTFQKVTLYV